MKQVIGVSFNDTGRTYYFLANDLDYSSATHVIVETEKGTQFASIKSEVLDIDPEKFGKKLKKVLRVATKKDEEKYAKNLKDASSALEKSKKTVKKLNLNMQLIDSAYTFDRKQLIFTFSANKRVDFRELVKIMANDFKTRIELHQIGPRDKAKKVGGLGPCGRPLCCSNHLEDFAAISINMAKIQGIALTPSKINGLCGRLKCCLEFENETYKECSKCVPRVGKTVKTSKGKGRVVNVNALKKLCVVKLESGEYIEEVIDLCGSNK